MPCRDGGGRGARVVPLAVDDVKCVPAAGPDPVLKRMGPALRRAQGKGRHCKGVRGY